MLLSISLSILNFVKYKNLYMRMFYPYLYHALKLFAEGTQTKLTVKNVTVSTPKTICNNGKGRTI